MNDQPDERQLHGLSVPSRSSRLEGLLRVAVRRILRKYGYPPDLQEKATKTVMEQAELLADPWAA